MNEDAIVSSLHVTEHRAVKNQNTVIYLWGNHACVQPSAYDIAYQEKKNKTQKNKETFTLKDNSKFPVSRPVNKSLNSTEENSVCDLNIQVVSNRELEEKNYITNIFEKGDDPQQFSFDCSLPSVVTSLSSYTIVEVSAGEKHAIFRSDKGELFALGVGHYGELGLGFQRIFAGRPTKLDSIANITCIQVTCGKNHSVALSLEGDVYSWGNYIYNGFGQGCHQFLPMVLNKSLFFSGVEIDFIVAHDFLTAAYSQKHSELFVWGETCFNSYYIKPFKFSNCFNHCKVIRIAFGKSFAFALSDDGKIFAWGDKTYIETKRIYSSMFYNSKNIANELHFKELILTDTHGDYLPKVVDISVSDRHCLLLTEKGTAYAFGGNFFGQCGISTSISKFYLPHRISVRTGNVQVTARYIMTGRRHSVLINDKNQLMTWGNTINHKLLHTAAPMYLLQSRISNDTNSVGLSVISGLEDCCVKPKLVYSLLHKKISCVCLKDEITIVVTEG